MLRWAVALLLLLNLGFFAWSHGWLGGDAADTEREPERLQRQHKADTVRVLGSEAASAAQAASAVAAATACLQAGPFTDAQWAAAEQAVLAGGVPSGRWTAEPAPDSHGSWLLYMGRYASAEAMQKKADELRRRHVAFEPLQGLAELQPGLQLGRFDSDAAAQAALEQLGQRGVHTARVITLPSARQRWLRLDGLQPPLLDTAKALKAPALGAAGFSAC
jgi:hypothetical protein